MDINKLMTRFSFLSSSSVKTGVEKETKFINIKIISVMKKVFILWVVMAIATAAAAQYNEVTMSPAEQKLELIKKEIKVIEKTITSTEKKRNKELSLLKAYEVRDLEKERDVDVKADIVDKYESDKDSIVNKYEKELKPLREAKEAKFKQLTSPAPIPDAKTVEAAKTVDPEAKYEGLLVNPLWKDVNFVIKDKAGKKTGYYLAKGQSMSVSLPAGNYVIYREWNGYMVGWSHDFKVEPGKTNYYKGIPVAFYSVATDH